MNWFFRMLFFNLFTIFFKRLSVLLSWHATSQLFFRFDIGDILVNMNCTETVYLSPLLFEGILSHFSSTGCDTRHSPWHLNCLLLFNVSVIFLANSILKLFRCRHLLDKNLNNMFLDRSGALTCVEQDGRVIFFTSWSHLYWVPWPQCVVITDWSVFVVKRPSPSHLRTHTVSKPWTLHVCSVPGSG